MKQSNIVGLGESFNLVTIACILNVHSLCYSGVNIEVEYL